MVLLPKHIDVIDVHRQGMDLAGDARTGNSRLMLSPIHFPEELFPTCVP